MNGESEGHGTRHLDMETRLALVEQAIKHQALRIDGELIHVSERLKAIEEMLGENQRTLQESIARVTTSASENALAIKTHEASDAHKWFTVAFAACGGLLGALGFIVWSYISK